MACEASGVRPPKKRKVPRNIKECLAGTWRAACVRVVWIRRFICFVQTLGDDITSPNMLINEIRVLFGCFMHVLVFLDVIFVEDL